MQIRWDELKTQRGQGVTEFTVKATNLSAAMHLSCPGPGMLFRHQLVIAGKRFKANMTLPQIVLRQRASAGSWYVTFLVLTSVVRRGAEADQVLHLRDSYSCTVTVSYLTAGLRKDLVMQGPKCQERSKFPLPDGKSFLQGRYARWKCRSLGPV
jgi:hypothetical protein